MLLARRGDLHHALRLAIVRRIGGRLIGIARERRRGASRARPRSTPCSIWRSSSAPCTPARVSSSPLNASRRCANVLVDAARAVAACDCTSRWISSSCASRCSTASRRARRRALRRRSASSRATRASSAGELARRPFVAVERLGRARRSRARCLCAAASSSAALSSARDLQARVVDRAARGARLLGARRARRDDGHHDERDEPATSDRTSMRPASPSRSPRALETVVVAVMLVARALWMAGAGATFRRGASSGTLMTVLPADDDLLVFFL